MSFVIIMAICVVVAYSFCGSILYGDPWTWIFKENGNAKQLLVP